MAPSKRTLRQKSTLTKQMDRQKGRQTDTQRVKGKGQLIIFFVIYAEHQTLPGIRRNNNNNNNSWGNLTLPSINANKMSWICLPSRSHCLLSLSLVCLRLAVIKMNFSIQLNWNVKMLINLSIRWGPSTCPRTVPQKKYKVGRGRGPWNIMKAMNLFCMHLSDW